MCRAVWNVFFLFSLNWEWKIKKNKHQNKRVCCAIVKEYWVHKEILWNVSKFRFLVENLKYVDAQFFESLSI